MLIDITVRDDGFARLGICRNDVLTFDSELVPVCGDVTLFEYKGQYQLVWYIGVDILGYPIVVSRYINYPYARSLPHKNVLKGRIIKSVGGVKKSDVLGSRDIQIAKNHCTVNDFLLVESLHELVTKIEHNFLFGLTIIFHIGVMSGKRQERAKRKKWLCQKDGAAL